MGFVNLHLHTAKGSLLDSIITVDQAISFAKNNNQSAIAITDHGYMSAYVDMVKAGIEQGVKVIIGCEVYEVDDLSKTEDTKDNKQQRYHLILLAKNQVGYKNLLKIVSQACTKDFYKKPRTNIDYIKDNNLGEGIICLTACLAGRVAKYITSYNADKAVDFVNKLKETFDYVAIEIQSHDVTEQHEANYRLINFAKYMNLPFVVTADAHYLNKHDAEAHSVFVKVSQDRDVGESYRGCYLQTEEDVLNNLIRLYDDYFYDDNDIYKAIEETEHIASMIEDIDIGLNNENQMPIINVPDGYDSNYEYMRYLIYSTFEDKFGTMSEAEKELRKERIEMELPVIEALGYVDYFLMCYKIMNEAKSRGIPLGYARGSAAGCLCLFMLNVTQIDSVLWDLDFSRFANLGRKSLADIDIDISKRRRKEFIDMVIEMFGSENVSPISTFNTMSTKVAIRDVGKVLHEDQSSPYFGMIPYQIRNEVASAIPTIKTVDDLGLEVEKDVALKTVLSGNEKLREYCEKFPLWFEYVTKLENLPKSMGKHASAVLITPKPIVSYMPLCLDKDKGYMAQLEMHNAMDDLKTVKMDFLGLKQLDIVDDTLSFANLTWKDVDINHLDFKDNRVFEEVYQSGNTVGIFQMESLEAKKMCMDSNADNIEDIISVNAADRPATKEFFPTYCKNKLDKECVELIHEDLKDILGKTNYILLYQEQALSLFRYAGFPETEVDNARRAIGKKKEDVMKSLEGQFKSGLADKGWNEEQYNEMWELIVKQASYSFNRSHACSYGLLSYLTAWLKVHYPVEFMTACLTCNSGDVSKIGLYINECKRLGIKVLPPNINRSDLYFTPNVKNNSILFGLLAVKGLGKTTINNIITNRPFEKFDDFINKVKDKTATIALIKSGAFGTENKTRLLRYYAKTIVGRKEYKPVKTLCSNNELLYKWGINSDEYYIENGKRKDKVRLLEDYNTLKRAKFEYEENERVKNEMREFQEKYGRDEWLWEFQSLSMFVTEDPLEFAWSYITSYEEINVDEYTVMVGMIISIQKKKDRRGSVYCYINLYTPSGMHEIICWASTFKKYLSFIEKGKCIAVWGEKNDNGNLVVEEIKDYKEWLVDRRITQKKE